MRKFPPRPVHAFLKAGGLEKSLRIRPASIRPQVEKVSSIQALATEISLSSVRSLASRNDSLLLGRGGTVNQSGVGFEVL